MYQLCIYAVGYTVYFGGHYTQDTRPLSLASVNTVAALKPPYLTLVYIVTVADVTLKLPSVGGQILQHVEGEAEPGVLMASRARLLFKGDYPLHRLHAGGAH